MSDVTTHATAVHGARTALVTGSSSGIGLDIARAFLEAGANVVLNGRDADRLAKAAAALGRPERTAWVAGDIADRGTGEALVRTALDRFGTVDVLVNNAGTFASKPFTEVTEEELDGFLTHNLKGTYLTTQAFVRGCARRGAAPRWSTSAPSWWTTAWPASRPRRRWRARPVCTG